jgi:mannose-1-phosphate guanylyltransferase
LGGIKIGKPEVRGVILAGGPGTRFRPLTYYLQKCMIPVGEEEKPVLEHIIRLFVHHEIRDLVLLVDYKYRQIKNYFSDGSRFGVKLHYMLDKPGFKGSAGAIVNMYRQGIINTDDHLVVYYGDILSNFDLKKMVSQHIKSEAAATVALANGFRIRVGTANVKNGLIKGFHEKPEIEAPVSVGMLVISRSVLKEMDKMHKGEAMGSFDMMGDVIPHLIKQGKPVGAYVSEEFWYDLGSLERYEQFEKDKLDRMLKYPC